MNYLLTIAFAFTAWTSAIAQEVVPPKFQGADANRFAARLIGEAEKIVTEGKTPAAELSSLVTIGFTVDEQGAVVEWRYLDNTCEGRDYRDTEPATARMQEVLKQAMERLERWTPAEQVGAPTTYPLVLTVRFPVEKIARMQAADPLLFMGLNPDESFHKWAKPRFRYDERFTAKGVEGVIDVRFFIEPDGKITVGEVKGADEKLAREVVRVIRSSKGYWTPRKVSGVPQRTEYNYRINFFND